MKTFLYRPLGIMLILVSVLGVIFSVTGLVYLWQIDESSISGILETMDLLDRTLTTTKDLLDVASSSLDQIDADIILIQTSINDASVALNQTAKSTNSTATLIGDNLSDVVLNTQAALLSVQSSAKVIDDTLSVISSIPFIGTRYKPPVPLQDSIAQVRNSLDPVPASLQKVQQDLNTTADNFQSLRDDMDALEKNMGEIRADISRAKGVMDEYKSIVGELDVRLGWVHDHILGWVRTGRWGVTGILVWLLFAQIGLFIQGQDLMRRS